MSKEAKVIVNNPAQNTKNLVLTIKNEGKTKAIFKVAPGDLRAVYIDPSHTVETSQEV